MIKTSATKLNTFLKTAIIVLVIFLTVFFNFTPQADAKDYVYAAPNASGEMTGEKKKPFKSIQRAIDAAEKDDKKVILLPGTYYENNIDLWDDVILDGLDKNKVTIIGENEHKAVITMYDDSEIQNLTIRNGKRGVYVAENADVLIWDCRINDNDKDGIKVEEAKIDDKHRLNIQKTIIAYNGWNGIYAKQRNFYLKDNFIYKNGWDGIEFDKNSEGTIKDTKIKENDGLGIRLTIDGSWIYIKDCTIRDNDKSGIEVRSKGGNGKISLDRKTKLYKNEDYGIVRLNDGTDKDQDYWNDHLKIDSDVRFWDNDKDPVSDIIKVDC
ncbi:MAG: DUF1565 domain-containing protein [Candidatus Moranbacteria bacterium]|nr:DUF1565 domain-containing protein [Candidatus Moranbacteria bacterium]